MTSSARIVRTLASRTRRALVAAAVVLATVGIVGCKQFIMLGYLIGGPPSIAPDFDEETGRSMTDYGVTVAVVCYAPKELKWDFAEIDTELAKHVAFRLVEHHVKVIDPEAIRAWTDENDDWDSPAEIGEVFDASYVVYIDLVKYSLFEENSANLFRGRAEALVSVYAMDEAGGGEEIFKKDVISRYPIRMPRSTSSVSYSSFKAEYLSRLSEEIGRLFYEHYLVDEIDNAG